MGFHLPASCTISGVPSVALVEQLSIGETIFLHDASGPSLEILECAQAAGLVTRPNADMFERTELGFALSKASFRPRVTLAEADRTFDDLLARLDRIEAEGHIFFPEIWLYGSYMRRDPMVGDIDLCIDWGFPSEAVQNDVIAKARRELRAAGSEGAWGSRDRILNDWIRQRLDLHDVPMFQHLSLDSADIRMLAAPCQLIHRGQGGLQFGEILPHHPAAFGDGPPSGRLEVETSHGIFRTGRLGPDAIGEAVLATLEGAMTRNAANLRLELTGPELGTLYRDLEMEFGGLLHDPSPLFPAWRAIVAPLSEKAANNAPHTLDPDAVLDLIEAARPLEEPELLVW